MKPTFQEIRNCDFDIDRMAEQLLEVGCPYIPLWFGNCRFLHLLDSYTMGIA